MLREGHGLVLVKGDDGKIVGATCACGWHSAIKRNTALTGNERRKKHLNRKHRRYVWWMENGEASILD